jgi:outer membrane protein assembly factor BamC
LIIPEGLEVKQFSKLALLTLCAALAACSVLEGEKIDYKSAGKGVSLEVPPDLTQLSRDSRYVIVGGTVTASGFQVGQAAPGVPTAANTMGDVRIERAGNQRWLVVNRPADQLWSPVRDFWQENGFLLSLDQASLGIMETDWAENRAKLPQDFIRNTLGKIVDSIYSTSERDKFRTRLERTANGGTEIYISHRGMVEVYSNNQKDQTVWQPRPADPELETEFLRRLMVKLGAPQDQVRAQVHLACRQCREHAGGDDRRRVRPRLAPCRPGAGPHRLHGGRPRPQPGHVLRALCRADRRPQGTGLLRQAVQA